MPFIFRLLEIASSSGNDVSLNLSQLSMSSYRQTSFLNSKINLSPLQNLYVFPNGLINSLLKFFL